MHTQQKWAAGTTNSKLGYKQQTEMLFQHVVPDSCLPMQQGSHNGMKSMTH